MGEHLAVPVLQAARVGDAEESGVPAKREQVRETLLHAHAHAHAHAPVPFPHACAVTCTPPSRVLLPPPNIPNETPNPYEMTSFIRPSYGNPLPLGTPDHPQTDLFRNADNDDGEHYMQLE